jgi:cytidylate kinase
MSHQIQDLSHQIQDLKKDTDQKMQKMIKNSTIIEVEGGHAAYLISPSSKFQQQYNNWLKTALELKEGEVEPRDGVLQN